MHPLIRRLQQTVITMIAAITFSFFLIHQLPGGPLTYLKIQLARQGADPQELNNLAEIYLGFQPDAPLHVQYYRYVIGALQGDFGTSFIYGEPVFDILLGAVPWTVLILGTALLLNYAIGITMGALMAYKEGSKTDVGGTVFSIVLTSVPYYVIAILLLYFFAYQNGYFPTNGRYGSGVTPGLSVEFFRSVAWHAALPVGSLVFTSFASLGMRANSISVLGSDYMRVAKLRGLPTRRIVVHYVVHNAVLPLYTSFMISLGAVFGGSIILEKIFVYPGVGWYLLKGVNAKDYSLMMGGFMIITAGVLTALLIGDLTYSRIDPRAGGIEDESY